MMMTMLAFNLIKHINLAVIQINSSQPEMHVKKMIFMALIVGGVNVHVC